METKDAGATPAADMAKDSGADSPVSETQLDQSRDHTGDPLADVGPAPDPAFEAHVVARSAAFEKMRAETPPQTIKLRPEAKQQLLGVVIHFHDAPPRCIRMEDLRTDQVTLKAGDRIVIVVLAGEDLDTFERYQRIEQRAKEPPKPAAVPDRLVGGDEAGESGIGAAAAGV